MAKPMPLRPSRSSLHALLSSISSRPTIRSAQCQFSIQQIRQESTRKRLKRKLKIAPAPAFTSATEAADHILFAPPSSAPNVYHTPLKFLPANDPRRALYSASPSSASTTPTGTPLTADEPNSIIAALQSVSSSSSARTVTHASASASASADEPALGPIIAGARPKSYHLTEKEINEIRHLRLTNPQTWTVSKLSQMYKVTPFFVRIVAKNEQAGREQAKRLEATKARWGAKRREAREDRARRQALWGRG